MQTTKKVLRINIFASHYTNKIYSILEESIDYIYDKFLNCNGVSIDTRSIQQGDLFFGIKGPNFDGNTYAEDAITKGAKYAIIDDDKIANLHPQYIYVNDSLQTLQDLALHHRKQFNGHVLALTGSNGKTTTKELIVRALSRKYKVHGTEGNFNNHLGVPLTLLKLPSDTEIAVIEMGANKVGDIAELCNIALPSHGLITNIGIAHAGGFGGREGVIRGKSELFDFLRKTNGTVFINSQDLVVNNMAKRFSNPFYYPDQNCQLVTATPTVKYRDLEDTSYTTHLIGEYNFINIAAAMCVANFFQVDSLQAHEAISTYIPDNNRSQIVQLGTNQVILDAYNANPDSMKVALQNLLQFDNHKRMALLGSMKELGELSEGMHQEIHSLATNSAIEQAYFVGKEFSGNLDSDQTLFNTTDELIAFLIKNPISNTTVLIKGSRSIAMERLVKVPEIWN